MKKNFFLALLLSVTCFLAFTPSSAQPGSPNLLPGLVNSNQAGRNFKQQSNDGGTIVLRGTIILPDGVMKHGYVAINNGLIASVSEKAPDLPGAVTVNTNGIILPELVDIHNHVPFNVIPRWNPGRLFTNRNQWRTDPEVLEKINGPVDRVSSTLFCDMNTWGELRALVGGTTSIMVTQPQPCINGLVRNLDLNSGFYGTTELNREHIFNVLDLPPASNPAARAAFVGAANFFISNPFYEALFIHLAEGTDAASREEFTFMQPQSLLNPKGVVIHGIPLTATDFQAMGLHGTALVWSPRSNLELYGTTTNIHAALDAGVEIALAPDWGVTGSSNMLDELKVADEWNRRHLGGRLTDKQLVEMVTSSPAHIAGVDDEVGSLKVGLRADILVINGDNNKPYRAVIDRTAADVELVFINGVPLYGDEKLMKHFWDNNDLEKITLHDVTKTLATPAANIEAAGIENRLQLALQAEGTSLAPLAEAGNFVISPAIVSAMPGSPGNNHKSIQGSDAQDANRNKEDMHPGKLLVNVLHNPTANYFTISTQSGSGEPLQLRVLDVSGRILETRKGLKANSTFYIGHSYLPGIYFTDVIQGRQRRLVKLVRK